MRITDHGLRPRRVKRKNEKSRMLIAAVMFLWIKAKDDFLNRIRTIVPAPNPSNKQTASAIR